jgi:hypothetical protein
MKFSAYGLTSYRRASIVEYLLKGKRDNVISITFFFPRFDDTISLEAETILRSIIRQSLNSNDLPSEIESRLEKIEKHPLSSLEAINDLLEGILALSKACYIIIDALDEFDKSERDILLKTLSSLSTAGGNVKLFLAGRDSLSEEIKRRFQPVYHISMSCTQAQSDISRYISEIIDERLSNGDLVVGDNSIIQEIQDALIQGAQGM